MAGAGFLVHKFRYRLMEKVSPLPVPRRGAWKRADFALDREPRRGAWKRSDLQFGYPCHEQFPVLETGLASQSVPLLEPSSTDVTKSDCVASSGLDVEPEDYLLKTVPSSESLLERLSAGSAVPELSEEEFAALFGQNRRSGVSGPQPPKPVGVVPPIFQNLSAPDLENLVARLYRAQGYPAVWVTSPLPNRCVDVVAARDVNVGLELLAIHCVAQEGVVDSTELKKLLKALLAHPSYSAGIVVSTATFSSDAFQFAANDAQLKLIDGNRLAELLVQHRVPIRR